MQGSVFQSFEYAIMLIHQRCGAITRWNMPPGPGTGSRRHRKLDGLRAPIRSISLLYHDRRTLIAALIPSPIFVWVQYFAFSRLLTLPVNVTLRPPTTVLN